MATARSTRFGSALTGVLFAIGLGAASLAVGLLRLALAMVAAGILIGIAIAFRRTASPAAQAAAAILVPVAAVAETVGIGLVLAQRFDPSGLAGASPPIALVLALAMLAVPLSVGIGAMVGGLGLIASLRTEVDPSGVAQLIGTALFTMVLVGVVFAISLALRLAFGQAVLDEWLPVVEAGAAAATGAIGPADPETGLLTFFVLLTAAGFSGFQALRTVPVSELAPSAYRSEAERAVSGVGRLMSWAAVIGLFGAVVLVTTADSGTIEAAIGSAGAVRRLVLALGSERVQWLLVLLVGGFAAIAGALGLLQWLTGGVTSLLQRLVPASAGALAITGFAAVESPGFGAEMQARAAAAPEPVPTVLEVATPAELVLLLAALALAVLVLTLVSLIAVGVMGLVPNRTLGGVLVGSGLGLGAIALALGGGSAVTVFGVFGLAVLSWDVSDRSGRAVADLHRGRGPALSVELLQWLASAGVALLSVLAALGLMGVVQGARPLPVTEYTLAALAAVAAAVVLLVAVIRG